MSDVEREESNPKSSLPADSSRNWKDIAMWCVFGLVVLAMYVTVLVVFDWVVRIAITIIAAATGWKLWYDHRREVRRKKGQCMDCGHPLGLFAERCKACGAVVPISR